MNIFERICINVVKTFTLLGCLLFVVPLACAQGYPNRPIRLIVPAPAGGGTDILARLISDGLTKSLGQPIIVENRGGASGMVGADAVLKAPADGYTFFMVYSTLLTVNPSLFKNLSYDSVKSFAPVANFVNVPNILIVNPTFKVDTLADIIKLAKESPGKLNYASSAHGTINHLFAELLKLDAGINIIHVPYNGGAPAMTAVMGGQVDMMVQNFVEALPHIKSGRVKPIAIASLQRSTVLPEVPTLDENGFKGYESALWYGIVAAAGTPSEAIKTVNEAMKRLQESPAMRERLVAMGLESVYMTPNELAEHIKREIEKWSGVVRAAGIKPD